MWPIQYCWRYVLSHWSVSPHRVISWIIYDESFTVVLLLSYWRRYWLIFKIHAQCFYPGCYYICWFQLKRYLLLVMELLSGQNWPGPFMWNHIYFKMSFLFQHWTGQIHAATHLVNVLMVHEAMYPVNTHVSKEQETANAQEHPRPAWKRDSGIMHTRTLFTFIGRLVDWLNILQPIWSFCYSQFKSEFTVKSNAAF